MLTAAAAAMRENDKIQPEGAEDNRSTYPTLSLTISHCQFGDLLKSSALKLQIIVLSQTPPSPKKWTTSWKTMSWCSFIADIGSSSVHPVSLISLTMQRMDVDSPPAGCVDGLHINRGAAGAFVQTLEIFSPCEHRQKYPNIWWMPLVTLHYLILGEAEGLPAQWRVADALAVRHKIAGHFILASVCFCPEEIHPQLNQLVRKYTHIYIPAGTTHTTSSRKEPSKSDHELMNFTKEDIICLPSMWEVY